MFLLDTNVVSELRKVKAGKAHPGVANWAARVDAGVLYVSAITIMELEIGVKLLEQRDANQGAILRAWFNSRVIPEFVDRVLPINSAVARRCAHLHVPDPASQRDLLIAATALVYGMTVVTRNTAVFERTGAVVVNPWLVAT